MIKPVYGDPVARSGASNSGDAMYGIESKIRANSREYAGGTLLVPRGEEIECIG